jgi:hypothetical protein
MCVRAANLSMGAFGAGHVLFDDARAHASASVVAVRCGAVAQAQYLALGCAWFLLNNPLSRFTVLPIFWTCHHHTPTTPHAADIGQQPHTLALVVCPRRRDDRKTPTHQSSLNFLPFTFYIIRRCTSGGGALRRSPFAA